MSTCVQHSHVGAQTCCAQSRDRGIPPLLKKAGRSPAWDAASLRPYMANLLGLLLALSLHAQDPRVTATLEAPDTVWTGQKVTLVVELMAPGYFASAASFDLPDPGGVLLLPPTDHPVVSGRTIDDVYYTVQRHELAVYPAAAGARVVPPLSVRFGYKLAPLDRDEQSAALTTPALPLKVTPPPGAERLGQVISARNLQAVETWEPEPGKAPVKAGDAFTRTITFTAPEVPGMIFPPFPTAPIDGLRLYPKPPVLLDHDDRGTLTGGRRDSIVYVCERSGTVTIPAVRLTWWDLDATALRTVDFPERSITVEAGPTRATSPVPTARAATLPWWHRIVPWQIVTIVATLATVAAFLLSSRLRNLIARLLVPLRPVHLQPLNPGK
jgi:hypothetical protein